MAFDYSKILVSAKKRVQDFGRELTLIRLDPDPVDAAKPWQGAAAPRTTPIDTLTVYGVFVEPESLERLGKQRASNDFIKSAEQVIIIAYEGSLGAFDEVIDTDGSRWKIANHQELGPGDTILLHYLRVQRRGKVTAVRGALL